jgi:hypothetical protein
MEQEERSRSQDHACHPGPVCAQGNGEGYCWKHESCDTIMREFCLPCETECCEAAARDHAEQDRIQRDLGESVCPVDLSIVSFRGHYAAPGTGTSWECEEGHGWAKVGGYYYLPEDMAHMLSYASVA